VAYTSGMAKKRKAAKPKVKPKRKPAKSDKPPTDPNQFAKWLVDRTTN